MNFRFRAEKSVHRSTWYLVHDDTCNYRDRRKGDKYTRIQRSRDLVNIVCKSNADFHFAARAGVKRNVRLSLIELGITYDTRIRGRQGSWWTIDISSTRVIKS